MTVTAVDLSLAEGTAVDVHRSRSLARRLIDRDAPHSDSDIGAAAVTALSDDLLPVWYDDWAVIAAEDWRQLRLHALEAVAARLTAAERLAEAAAAALDGGASRAAAGERTGGAHPGASGAGKSVGRSRGIRALPRAPTRRARH